MKRNKSIYCFILFMLLFLLYSPAFARQGGILLHSSDDQNQKVPFYQAYAQGIASIEADIYLDEHSSELLVGSGGGKSNKTLSLDEAYIEPLINMYKKNNGRAWEDSDNTFVLLLDLKSPVNPALDILIPKLKAYPDVFDSSVNPHAVHVVISGNIPQPEDFAKYPRFISFDGNRTDYTPEQLKRIYMISPYFSDYAQWNGKGSLKRDEHGSVEDIIEKVHSLGKPIRFVETPDAVTAWNTLCRMGVDYLSTCRLEQCTDYFANFENKNYYISGSSNTVSDNVALAKRLDKTTAGFQGFNNKKLQLTHTTGLYQPTYKNDGAHKLIRNVILLIGDGMGIAQLCAGETVNNGLTTLLMRFIGLQKTSSKDAYTTDSAAAGSALATGESHSNRHISISDDGIPYPSMSDRFAEHGYACGVISLGNIADATPAAFYGHSTERDNSDEITNYLLDNKINILVGSGMEIFTKRQDGRDLFEELKSEYRIATTISDISNKNDKVICIDERMGNAASEENLSLLTDATSVVLKNLSVASRKGFFLMVEGAKIDYAGHANSLPGSILETLSFDMAVAEALKFADSNGETLVIVTGDHETGGLSLVDGDRENGHITARYMTDDHTPLMLPVFAYGPGAQEFTGVYQNTQLFHKVMKLMKF